MQELTPDNIENRGTQTHSSEEGAREVVLVGIPMKNIASKNMYPPPSPFESNGVESQMRQGYFLHNETLIVQIPRTSDNIEGVQKKIELTDICSDFGHMYAYYPMTTETALRLSWDYKSDSWDISEQAFEDFTQEIDSLHDYKIWRNRQLTP